MPRQRTVHVTAEGHGGDCLGEDSSEAASGSTGEEMKSNERGG
jgi:hypothetical protein